MSAKFLIAGVLLLSSGAANAALINYVGGNAYTTPAPQPSSLLGNNVIPGTSGMLGGNLSFDSAVRIDWTFLGKEAGYTNFLRMAGCNVNNQTAIRNVTSCSTTQNAGQLIYSFFVQNTGRSVGYGVAGAGANYDPNVYTSLTTPTVFFSLRGDGSSFFIALDDGGGGPDDNHDDHVFLARVTAVGVPEPAAVSLLAFAVLVGAGAKLRRRLR